jgi:alkylhydroperoxidase/carboxymuconolactone decarboxylase family protein YurZ
MDQGLTAGESSKRKKERSMYIKKCCALMATLCFLLGVAVMTEAGILKNDLSLSAKQQGIIPIAAFTASGHLQQLTSALNNGLDSGLSVNEIKEILIQMYAYAGFPRSLNGINTFISVLDERQAKGIKDEVGKEAGAAPFSSDVKRVEYGANVWTLLSGNDATAPPSRWQQFVPVFDTFLKQHLFADVFARDILDYQSRELATLGALSNMSGTSPQLRFHFGAAMNTGLTEVQMKDFISVLRLQVGEEAATAASEVLTEVLGKRK